MNAHREMVDERAWLPRPRTGGTRPRVAVVADQRLTGQTVGAALQASGFAPSTHPVPRQASAVRELKERLARQQVGVAVLLNERVDWVHTSQAMNTIREIPTVSWLMLSSGEEPGRWGAALEAGAAATGSICVGVDELTEILHQLMTGVAIIEPEERSRLVQAWEAERHLTDRLARLTPRERQVLEELRQGHGVAEIAAGAFVSVGTVRSQVNAVLNKLEVPSQLAAVALLDQASATSAS